MINLQLLIGFIGVILINSCYLPQLIKTIKSKKAGDISLMFYLLLISGMFFSLTYAISRRDIVYVVSGISSIIQSGLMIFLKIKYTKVAQKRDEEHNQKEREIVANAVLTGFTPESEPKKEKDIWGD